MEKDGLTELAKLFKDRDAKLGPCITTGIVVAPPPNPRIRLNDVVVLDKEHLVFASHMLGGYGRRIKFSDVNCGITTSVNDGGQGARSHSHGIAEIRIDTTMQFTDSISPGEEVILIPVMDGQLYYVMDKAVRF